MISVLHRPERRCVLVLGGAPPATTAYFAWDAQAGATSYTLEIGSATTQKDVYDSPVGNYLSAGVPLASGTYYWRATGFDGATELDTTDERTVTIA